MNNNFSHDSEMIRLQVLLALAANRTPGFHYPGHLPGCHWPRIGEDDLGAAMPDGPQARNVDGTVIILDRYRFAWGAARKSKGSRRSLAPRDRSRGGVVHAGY